MRDGRDVIDSKLDMHKENSWGFQRGYYLKPLDSEKERERTIYHYSTLWVATINSINLAYQHHDPNLRLILKYEDLISEPLNQLKKVYNFLGISFSDNELNQKIELGSFNKIPDSKKGEGKFFRLAKPGNWKIAFSEEEQKIMQDIMGKTLSDFGY